MYSKNRERFKKSRQARFLSLALGNMKGDEHIVIKYLYWIAILLLQVSPALGDDLSESGLRAAEQRRLDGWSDGDVSEILEIECGAQGFGHSSSLRSMDCETYQTLASEFLAGFEEFDIVIEDAQYRVMGNVGLVAGKLVREEKYHDGTSATRLLRYTATYYFEKGKWRMLQYHRSPILQESPQ